MKRLILLLLCLVLLTGCTTEQDRTIAINELYKKGYITGDSKQVYYWATSAAPVPGIKSYSYVYKLSDDSLTEILLSNKYTIKDSSSSATFRETYLPYFKVELTTNVEVEEYNDIYSANITDISEKKTVYLVREKFLLFNYWKDYDEAGFESRFKE